MQYIVIGRDGKDERALERRMAARSAHIELTEKLVVEGKQLFAVAILNEEGKMCGSIIIVDYPTREELDAWLRVEPYVTGNVWEQIEITPCKVGPSFAKK